MDLATPEDKVRKLQETLQAKAKGTPSYRFYLLYDKVYRPDVLAFAYQRSRENGGKPGVDGQTFDDIKEYGVGAAGWVNSRKNCGHERTNRRPFGGHGSRSLMGPKDH